MAIPDWIAVRYDELMALTVAQDYKWFIPHIMKGVFTNQPCLTVDYVGSGYGTTVFRSDDEVARFIALKQYRG